jgi:hydrogenase nickel incorporation protein HypB
MCSVCGCGHGETRIDGVSIDAHHDHGHDHGHDHAHCHDPAHGHDHGQTHAHHAHADGLSPSRMVRIEQDILALNNQRAAANRARWRDSGVFAVNLVSSPGSGKTTWLVETIRRLGDGVPLAVIEGDQQTSHDAERIRATGARAVQINTGKGCHLDAAMVGRAADGLPLPDGGLLLIENVGNLVCPAEFDLGEAHKVVLLSVTEGEDKPLKYPQMFAAADLMLLTKTDLLPYLSFDVARCLAAARRVNPTIEVMQVSSTNGAGFEPWLGWLRRGVQRARGLRPVAAAAIAPQAAGHA